MTKLSVPIVSSRVISSRAAFLPAASLCLMLCLSACTAKIEPGKEYGNQLGAIEYTIQPGDNLVLIASEQTRASENWRRIADFNRIQNPASIKVGQKIWIPNDLIPLTNAKNSSREVAGHPGAVVNAVKLPAKINPVGR